MSIFSYIVNGDVLGALVMILSRCFVVFCCLPIHELSHAFVAYKLGDPTAKNQHRLTFNPIAHLNLVGTIMIFLFGIGYANPVPVNSRYFKKPKEGMALVALAGPLSNLLMAFITNFIYVGLAHFNPTGVVAYIAYFFYYAASVNVILAVFNLLPIPPLDGSKILAVILPDSVYYKYMQYERYVMIAVLILLFTNILNKPLGFLANIMMKLISIIPNLIF